MHIAIRSYDGERPIVFFDGSCVMCNEFIDTLLQLDTNNKVLIATLQGQTAQYYLSPLPEEPKAWSFLYLDKQALYAQSDAVVQLSYYLGGGLSMVGTILQSIPSPIRNGAYRFIAQNRYQWLGQRATCRMPTEAEKQRFLP